MKKVLAISTIVLLGLILAACSSNSTSPTPVAAVPVPTLGDPAPASASSGDTSTEANLTQTNDAASVTVEVTPLDLDDQSVATLDFQIVLNTHSVDLSYDLTSIATLRSDSGEEVKPAKWDGPTGGGHHRSGILSFPQLKNRGQSVTLVLRGIADVPERIFEWKVK